MMNPLRIGLVLAALAIALAEKPASAWQANIPIGTKVVRKWKTELWIGGRVVNDDTTFRVYTVTAVRPPWLGVASGSVKGWVLSSKVVPFDQAIDYYTEQIQIDPGASWAYNHRGLIWHEKKEHDIALADYNEAIRLDPKDATAYINRGNAWDAKKEYDKALADYNEAIRLNPKNALAYSNRGDTWRKKKEYDKAIADCTEAIRLDPKYALAYNNRGLTWSDKQEHDKALADYNEAIRLDPKDAWAYNSRAWLWATCPDEKYRDGERAVESATRACVLTEWNEAYPIGTLAAAYAEAGEFEKAIEHQEKAAALYEDEEDKLKGQKRLELYREQTPYRETA